MPFASAEELFGSKSPFQTKRENEWPLVLCAAHFDESHEKPGLAVAGYSAAIDTWWRLDCQWQALLKRWNLKYFKASECEKGLVEFAQYRDDLAAPKSPLKPHERERLRKVKLEFIDAICARHHVLQGYGAAIATEDFKRIIAEDPIAPIIFLDKSYYIGAQLCLVAAAMLVIDINICRSGKQLLATTNNTKDDYMRVSLHSLLPAIHRVFRLDYKNLKQITCNHSPDSIPIRHLLLEELCQW